jgi:fructokinase
VAFGLVSVISVLSPQRIILGGGVGTAPELLPLVRPRVVELLNGYLETELLGEGIDEYIVPPALGPRSGVLGAIALAQAF